MRNTQPDEDLNGWATRNTFFISRKRETDGQTEREQRTRLRETKTPSLFREIQTDKHTDTEAEKEKADRDRERNRPTEFQADR